MKSCRSCSGWTHLVALACYWITLWGAVFSVVVSNAYGNQTSANAALTVNLPPTIAVQPQPQAVIAPATATFTSCLLKEPVRVLPAKARIFGTYAIEWSHHSRRRSSLGRLQNSLCLC